MWSSCSFPNRSKDSGDKPATPNAQFFHEKEKDSRLAIYDEQTKHDAPRCSTTSPLLVHMQSSVLHELQALASCAFSRSTVWYQASSNSCSSIFRARRTAHLTNLLSDIRRTRNLNSRLSDFFLVAEFGRFPRTGLASRASCPGIRHRHQRCPSTQQTTQLYPQSKRDHSSKLNEY